MLPLVKFQQNQTIYGGVRAQKLSKNGHLMDAELVRKHLKIYNLTTTHAILMSFATIMYFHKLLLLAKIWGVTHRYKSA